MRAMIGLTLKQAKEVAKQELGVKRMGEARFQMILDEGVKRGDFIISEGSIQSATVDSFFDLDPIEEGVPSHDEGVPSHDEVQGAPPLKTKQPHPPEAQLDPKLSSSDLPRAGDLYHYRSYSGEVVQGEVISTICFAECLNPDGTWQSVAFQDLHLKKRGVSKETVLNHLNAHYQNNDHLRAERERLIKEIEQLKASKAELE